MFVVLLGFFIRFKVLGMLNKLCCTTAELEHDTKDTWMEVGQARAYDDASTAGTVHSQLSMVNICTAFNMLYCLLCLCFLLEGTTSEGSAGAKLSHQVSKAWGQGKLAPWRNCCFVYTAKLKSQEYRSWCWHSTSAPSSCYYRSQNGFLSLPASALLHSAWKCFRGSMDQGPRQWVVQTYHPTLLWRVKAFSCMDANLYVSWL